MKKQRSLISRIMFIALLFNIVASNHIVIGAASREYINNLNSKFRSLQATMKCAFTKEKCTDEQKELIQEIIGTILLSLAVSAEIGFAVYLIKRGQKRKKLMSALEKIAQQERQKQLLEKFKEWDKADSVDGAMDIALTTIDKGLVITPEILDELDEMDNEAMQRKLSGESYNFKRGLWNLFMKGTMKFSDKQTEKIFEKRLRGQF